MKEINLPDGRTLSLTGQETQEQLNALKDKLRATYGQPETRQSETQKPQPIAEPKESLARTVLDQGLQGATFGFADEITDRIGAGIAAPFVDQTYSELLNDARGLTKERQERQFEQRPGASIAANLGGALLTGGAGATTKAGSAAGNFLRSGNTTARIAKGLAAGAASGGAYGLGTGSDGERGGSALRGAVLGGAVGGAVPAVGGVARKLNTKTIVPTADKIRSKAQGLYAAARGKGAEFSDDATDGLIQAIQKQIPTDDFARQAIGEDEISALAKRVSGMQGQKMTLDSFENLDKWLGSQVQKAARVGDDDLARRYGLIQGELRDIVDDPNFIKGTKEGIDAYREATKQWRSYAKMRDVEQILDNAQYYVGGEASGIKSGFTRLAKQINSGKARGFTPEEVKAIKKAASTGRTEGLLRTFGSRLVPIIGAAAGGPKGAALGYAASTVGQAGAGGLRRAEATNIGKLIAQNTGLNQTRQLIPTNEMLSRLLQQQQAAAPVVSGASGQELARLLNQ